FGIRSIPTIMIFKNGQVVDMLNGAGRRRGDLRVAMPGRKE
ncbi:hypothetical protein ACUOFC_53795, partial [Escherichia sp. TWPC-MK]